MKAVFLCHEFIRLVYHTGMHPPIYSQPPQLSDISPPLGPSLPPPTHSIYRNLISLLGTNFKLTPARKIRGIDQITKILRLDIRQRQVMPTLIIHVKTHVTLARLPQLLTPGLDMVRSPPRVQRRDLPEQLIILGVDLVRGMQRDRREGAPDHDAKAEPPLGAAQAVALLNLLTQEQARDQARALAEADDALEARDAAVLLHRLADDPVHDGGLVRGRGFLVALAEHEPPVDPAVEGRAGREDRQHPEARRAFDGRLGEHEAELFREVPDQPARLDFEDGRVRAPAV